MRTGKPGQERQWARETFSGRVVRRKTEMLKMCIFAKDGDVKNSNRAQAISRRIVVPETIKLMVEILSY